MQKPFDYMSLLSNIRALVQPTQPVTAERRGFGDLDLSVYSGKIAVTEESALTFSAVYAAIRVISETIAQLPLNYYKKTEDGREKFTDSPLFKLVNSEPNKQMSKYVFIETFCNTLLTYGNAFAYIHRSKGVPTGLQLLHPDNVKVEILENSIVYSIEGINGKIDSMDILHVPDMSYDGVLGQSRIKKAQDNIALGLSAQKYGKEFFETGAKISGVLMHPGSIGADAVQDLMKSWKQTYSTGANGSFKTAILEEGMTYKPIQLRPDEAQFLATRKFSILEIARIFRVPPHKLADLERATFSNIEHQSQEFLTDTINPISIKIEQEFNRKLIFESDKGNTYFEHNTRGLLRGDAKARGEYYNKLFQIGAMTQNEIRSAENMNQIEGGNVAFVQMNMINSQKAGQLKDVKDE